MQILQGLIFLIFWACLVGLIVSKSSRGMFYGVVIGGSIFVTLFATMVGRESYDGLGGIVVFFMFAAVSLVSAVVLSVAYEIRIRHAGKKTIENANQTSTMPDTSLSAFSLGSLALSLIVLVKYYAQAVSRGYFSRGVLYDFLSDSAFISGIVLFNLLVIILAALGLYFVHKKKRAGYFLLPLLVPGIIINIGYLFLNN